ncbi:AEC family transporter [Coraliomargarita parva]|uniref:AEC family transporter n=1 Tax=Coraliomargarita parva TaxID=3014050 RepID=UPI0022B5D107|nr:AEC family transporter [Coraliomargarita parva]
MAYVINTLLPVFLLIGLGFLLAKRQFISESFLNELNKLTFWVALPALIIKSLSTASSVPEGTWGIFIVFAIATLLVSGLAYACFRGLKLDRWQMGTFIQAAFRGNLAYAAIPIIYFALRDQGETVVANAMAQTIFVFAPTMLLYNTLAVVVLQFSHHSDWRSGLRQSTIQILRNPLIQSSIVGVLLFLLPVQLPGVIRNSLELIGQLAAPSALLCVGGSMAFVSMEGRYRSASVASILKVSILPVLSLVLAKLAGLSGQSALILLILSASPTAAVSYIMAKELKGDVALAAGGITISTVLCIPSLALILALY